MKTTIIRALIPLYAIAVVYAMVAFIVFDLNPGNWALGARYALATMVVIFSGAGIALYEVSRSTKP